jgi:predicted nucleotidyltransferase
MNFEPPTMRLRFGSGSEAAADHRESLVKRRLETADLPTFDEIVAKHPAFAAAVSIYAAGSVVQGWGHANSDLDLYVITDGQLVVDERLESFERRVSTDDPVIRIVLSEFGPFRADIELWRGVQVDEIIERFTGEGRNQEAPELDKSEQDMLYRLASGRPLHGDDWWKQRRTAIGESGYGLWLAENRKLIAETYLEDVGGLLISGDVHTAVLAAQEAFAGALEALLATHGDYSINRKWLYRRLQEFAPTEIGVEEGWARLVMVGAADDPGGWAEATARAAQRLLLAVEEKAA